MVRVRLGGEGGASYGVRTDWPDQGTMAAVVATPGSVVLNDAEGRPALRLCLEQSCLTPDLLLRFEFFREQHFYGLGEGGAQFDRLGVVRRFWNFQANRGQGADIAMPLLLSTGGYGVFFDCARRATLEPGDAGDGAFIEYRAAAGGPIDIYLIAGDMRAVLGEAAALLGRATMPPRWALGYLQSSRHFDSAEEVRALAAEFRARDIPCDALIFLSTYGAAKGWNAGVGHLDWEPTLFAEADAMVREIRAQGMQVITHEYPVLHPDSPLFAEAEREGYLLGWAYPDLPPARPGGPAVYKEGQRMLDFSRAEVRDWWWRQHRALVEMGIAGWWLDGGEGPPEHVALRAGPSRDLHNRFDLLRQQAFAEGEARDRPDARLWLLCRSGGPGMQRFGAMPWSGDINTSFATLEAQIRTGLNVGMSGVPHWGTDAGGFYSVAPDTGELFVRWLQFAAFTSIFRGHGHVWRRHLPWSHGPEIEAICREIIRLRHRLMPYTYTLAWQAHREGLPMMRPLVLNYPDDPKTWDLGTQYLWGDDLLVAPVTREGATHWPVYLPAGRWFDFCSEAEYQGPCSVTVAAPLDRLPIFVRAGSIIPMGSPDRNARDGQADALTLRIYPSGESSFTLYEDDGHTNQWRQGVHAITHITCTESAVAIEVNVGVPHGHPNITRSGRGIALEIRCDTAPTAVIRDGQRPGSDRHAVSECAWSHEDGFVCVRMAAGHGSLRLER